jgi:hypothetical protein
MFTIEENRREPEGSAISGAITGPKAYATSGVEPRLDDLMRDPTTQAIMTSDRVQFHELNHLVTQARLGLSSRTPV